MHSMTHVWMLMVMQVTPPAALHQTASPALNGLLASTPSAAANPNTPAHPSGPQQLPEAVQNSWLVKSVLQPNKAPAAAGTASAGALVLGA
jgi:hypothetical protein